MQRAYCKKKKKEKEAKEKKSRVKKRREGAQWEVAVILPTLGSHRCPAGCLVSPLNPRNHPFKQLTLASFLQDTLEFGTAQP